MKKRILSLLLAILFTLQVPSFVFASNVSSEASSEEITSETTYDIPSQANEENLTKKEENLERESFTAEEKTTETTTDQDINPTSDIATFSSKSLTATKKFNVCYASAVKAKSSDKYATAVSFKTLTGFDDFDDAYESMKSYYTKYKNDGDTTKAYGMCITNKSGKIIAMSTGRCYAAPSTATMDIGSTYITDGHELFYYSAKKNSSTQSYVSVGISGVKAYVSSSQLTLVPRTLLSGLYKSASSSTKKYPISYYSVNGDGDLVHTYGILQKDNDNAKFESGEYVKRSYTYVVGKAPSFMTTDDTYYSMDQVTYYTSAYLSSSYKVGTYYSYFQFLPYRTKSSYSASEFNTRMSNYGSKSILKKNGSALISAQNTNGINALLELSFANLESAYGTSGYATSRNNLFGIDAVDTNPDNADYFKSAADCINEHSYRILSKGYFDTKTDSRYFGTCPGNKKIGVTVKYASDPYHGAKIGGIAYVQDKLMGSKDYLKYTIGMTKTACYVYAKPSTSSTKYYRMGTKGGSTPVGMTVAIIGESGDFYKVQTDEGVKDGKTHYSNKYDFAKSVGYIKKSDLTVISKGTGKNDYSITSTTTKPAKLKDLGKINTLAFYPARSYGFTPGYGNSFKVITTSTTTYKNTYVDLLVYNSSGKHVATVTKKKSGTSKSSLDIHWDGKATKGNSAGYKAGSYVKRSSKGTRYTIRVRLRYSNGYETKTEYSSKYDIKVYNKATRVNESLSKTTIKRNKQTSTLSMKPNRPGNRIIRVYNSKGKVVFYKKFYYKKAYTKSSVKFKGKGNYGSYKNKTLAKGTYKVKFTQGDYSYTRKIKLK